MDMVDARAFISDPVFVDALVRAERTAFFIAFGDLARKATQSGGVDGATLDAIENHAVNGAIERIGAAVGDGEMRVRFIEHVRTKLHDAFDQATGRI